MKQDILESIMNKSKSHKPLTIDEFDDLGKLLDLLYGDIYNDTVYYNYPISLLKAIYCDNEVIIGDEKSEKELTNNFESINTHSPLKCNSLPKVTLLFFLPPRLNLLYDK